MGPNQDLYDITSKVLLGIRDVLRDSNPDIVFVHGDTTTSLATGLAAFYQHIKLAHIEAGLRTYNLEAPWPEEMNRQLTDRICDYCFAPTEISKNNLLRENIGAQIIVTGNTVIDALLWAVDSIKTRPSLEQGVVDELEQKGYLPSKDRNYILVTGHRRENFGEGLLNICKALKEIALRYSDIDIVYPVHLNPQVQRSVYELLSGIGNIYLIAPLDYLPFVYMMQHCYLIITDSGGVQEEAPSLEKPVLVMRDTTERPEAVEAETVKLVGTDVGKIVESVRELLEDKVAYDRMARAHNPYGDGRAGERILDVFNQNRVKAVTV
jgi:UDP-N-acetylglucosamine 2-epimerase (non-hydrolysing)